MHGQGVAQPWGREAGAGAQMLVGDVPAGGLFGGVGVGIEAWIRWLSSGGSTRLAIGTATNSSTAASALVVAPVPAERHPAVVVAQPPAGPVLGVDDDTPGGPTAMWSRFTGDDTLLYRSCSITQPGAVQDVQQLRDPALAGVALLDPAGRGQPPLAAGRLAVGGLAQPGGASLA